MTWLYFGVWSSGQVCPDIRREPGKLAARESATADLDMIRPRGVVQR